MASDTPEPVARLLDNPATLLCARLCATAPFLFAGLTKLTDWRGGEVEMAHVGLQPAWLFNLLVLATELGASVLVVIDRKAWLGAGALGVFTFFATLLAHRFWELTGQARTMQLNSFLEHASICAAFIFMTVVSLRSGKR